MYDYTEFNKLVVGLINKGGFNITVRNLYDGRQVIVRDKNDNMWDAIIHGGSYGSNMGLLEIMGETIVKKVSMMGDDDEDDVLGWLTADEILEKI